MMGAQPAHQLDRCSTTDSGRRGPECGRAVTAPVVLGALLLVVLALAGAGSGAADAERVPPGESARAACESQVLELPVLQPDGAAWVEAANDSGLVAGEAWGPGRPEEVVVWTDPDTVISTGVVGTAEGRRATSVQVVDVNDSGHVAVHRWTSGRRGIVSSEAIVWSEGEGATVLPTPAARLAPTRRPSTMPATSSV